jgi:hypothetical protein
MYELTEPECAHVCKNPHSCCNINYCVLAIQYAKEEYGVNLKTTSHPTLLLMGETGCTCPPHFRPLCTVHTCEICSLGFKKGDLKWTKDYFKLRDKISKEEMGI